MSVADEIEKLNNLKKSGAITEEEYQNAKNSLLKPNETIGEKFSSVARDISSNENAWSMFMHFSQLCAFLVPLAGLLVPIVMWQVKKDESMVIDKHGRNIVNWIITWIIMIMICMVLWRIYIGIPLLGIVMVLGIVFPIIGGIKANNGEVWQYPFSIKFFNMD
jgi:uncharacterized protein